MMTIADRDRQAALSLFEHLQEDLNPHSFTIDEIVDEGWDNRSSVSGFPDSMPESARKTRVSRMLNYLIRQGLVEKSDDDVNLFCLTEAGHNKRHEV